ncbi:MAG: hypothetical protein OK457_04655 [Thaumarchaeota archaeon]|nr:hypothetical protein [Nitrososphaerota archaeon]
MKDEPKLSTLQPTQRRGGEYSREGPWTPLDPRALLHKLPENFTKMILLATITCKAITVIFTFFVVVLYQLGQETNPISNHFGIMPYMISSASIFCAVSYILYRKVDREIVFPLLFGIFLYTLFDMSADVTVTVRLIFGF